MGFCKLAARSEQYDAETRRDKIASALNMAVQSMNEY
eukprot:CAMPEP_0171781808 /NCGR_PEP_ID=MMETSP0991-20121206/60462_1 /TAXON_ID=483369 /ORGANISM="non described non described, Strain CCMP2098" /LENGTH=36 /DNA_ID= /DNA_START= /DNA_END= /DNA_ORIENTATION=